MKRTLLQVLQTIVLLVVVLMIPFCIRMLKENAVVDHPGISDVASFDVKKVEHETDGKPSFLPKGVEELFWNNVGYALVPLILIAGVSFMQFKIRKSSHNV